MLYEHTGRRAEWRQMVAEVVPLFVDPSTDGPLLGRAEQWTLVTEYKVQLLRQERQWIEAARLQGLTVDYDRQRAAPLLALPLEQLDGAQHNTLRSLSVSLHELGEIQREQGMVACVDSFQESYALSLRIADQAGAAICAFNLGRVYTEVPALCDLNLAEQWYRRGLELIPESDRLGRGKILGQLGLVALERFKEARQAGQTGEALTERLNAALQACQEALGILPPDEVDTRAVLHNRLGNIYGEVLPAYLEQAVAHWREAIRYMEQAGDLYGAARFRENVAIAYANVGRFDDALLFARAALRNFEQFGPAAADRVVRAQQLVALIEEDIAKRGERGR